jgi:predicted ATPase
MSSGLTVRWVAASDAGFTNAPRARNAGSEKEINLGVKARTSAREATPRRLDRLAPVKEVAQIGAVIGREFSYDLLAAVARRPERQLRDALDQLIDAGLVLRRGVPAQATFVFKHALVQDAAYGTLLRARRQDLHARIGMALEERLAIELEQTTSAGERAALLAHHWFKAEVWDKALTYTLEPAERARSLHALREAITHYWQALDMVGHLPKTSERRRIQIDFDFVAVWIAGTATGGHSEPCIIAPH